MRIHIYVYAQDDERSIKHSQRLMEELRALPYFPKETGTGPDRSLAVRLRKNKGKWTVDQLDEIRLLQAQGAETARADQAASDMEQIRALGYIPKQHSEQEGLAHRWARAVKSGLLSSEQIEEAEALTAAHNASLAQSMDPPPEACAPSDPLDAFAEVAESRLDQDLLMASNGMRTHKLMRRIRRYR